MSFNDKDIEVASDIESKTSHLTDEDGSNSSQEHNATHEHRWEPQVLQPRPISGLLALATTLACMCAALGVLAASDGQPKNSWRVQPTVPLAILSALGAGAIRYAKGCASPVAWWYRAIQGSTVRELEDQWQASRGVVGALTNLRRGRWISLATLLTTIMIIDGAMLQRASSVALVNVNQNVALQVPLSPEVPFGASGIETQGKIVTSAVSTQVVGDMMVNKAMVSPVQGCPPGSTCTGTVLGPGMTVQHCNIQTRNITNDMLHNAHAQWGDSHGLDRTTQLTGKPVDVFYNTIFEIIIAPPGDGDITSGWVRKRSINSSSRRSATPSHSVRQKQGAEIYTGIADWNTESGTYTQRRCTLVPAILQYDIRIEGGEISLNSKFSDARFFAVANNTGWYPQLANSTINGFTFSLGGMWWANSTALLWPSAPKDMIWQANPISFDERAGEYYDWKGGPGLHFSDPFDDILSSFNNILFRIGLATADWANVTSLMDPGLKPNRTIVGVQFTKENVYTADYRWFAGAAVLNILAVLVVLPLFWGWWTLPKHLVNNSPFEMALAFESPLVGGVHSAAGSPAVIDRFGGVRVAYGIVRNEGGSQATSATNATSHNGNAVAEMGSQRLGIGENTTRPRRGELITV